MIEIISRRKLILLINKFQQQLEQHIRFEEREFSPAGTTFTAAELEKMGEQLQHLPSENLCVNYKVKFWE